MNQIGADLELQNIFDLLGFVTSSRGMLPLLQRARKAAEASDVTVLLEGETGTGKQVLAQGIHNLDQKRKTFAFITVHCSTISEGLAESELFGHQRGAFSGAVSDRKGLFQAAQHGTILLDDVNDLPGPLQAKLLDVIQRGTVRPVGCDRELRIDVRVIAACNQPLEPMVREGRFRADLYHRLNVVKLSLPPLRRRYADLGSLLLALARRHSNLYGPIATVEPALLDFLATQRFPGNVRELENAVQRMLFLKTNGDALGLEDWAAQTAPEEETSCLTASFGANVQPLADARGSDQCSDSEGAVTGNRAKPNGFEGDPLREAAGAIWRAISQSGVSYEAAFQEIEKRVLEAAIGSSGCTRREIAQRLRTSERTLYYKMRAHGLGRAGAVEDPAADLSATLCS